ncbi:efflux RND transporter periplasmic adaptor subunit [Candidatus Palauibacter sp.]|uniref:efflux RND transporter periplasmic adaptor subunit n=1 Tax=Candidatus Palauibacter sp. TaxID=3101350 RepID=UPI003B024B0C
MTRNLVQIWILGSLAALGSWACGEAADVGQEAHDVLEGGGSLTRLADGIELFVEYPHQVEGLESEEPWEIHLTRQEGWRPVEADAVTLTMIGPSGARRNVSAEDEAPGIYEAVPTPTAAGIWQAEFSLRVEGREYTILAGPFVVFASEEDVEAAPATTGPIALSKQEQWSFPFGVAVAEEREIPASIPAAGELVAPPGGLVQVSAPVAGLVRVEGPSFGPGDFVRAGQTLALIAPISLDNSYARTRADVVAAEREAERAEGLFEAGAISARRLEEARRDLNVAEAAFEAIGGTPGSVGDSVGGGDLDSGLYRLRSPISGVITAREVALGQQIDIGGHAFTIVNAATLWFVARVPARYAPEANRIRGAWFTVEGDASAYTASRVLSVGSVIDPDNRTLPVRFAVPNPDRTLKVGMLAEGRILLGDPQRGVAVPTAAIQNENGLSVIYVKVTGSTFERRVVDAGASDGSWTLVSSGVDLGEEVVTAGAYQVSLASLGTSAPSDGHGH